MDDQRHEARLEATDEASRLRATIVEALCEIDYITLQVNPQIKTGYALKIGCWESELLKAQIAARRARRRAQIAQACANAGEPIDAAACNAQLDAEFAEWEKKAHAAVARYAAAMERRAASKTLSAADARSLKRLHRILVKRLHPDLHPLLGEEETRLFSLAQNAFEAGDLEALRSLEAATQYLETRNHPSSTDEIAWEAELLQAHLAVVQERLGKLKRSNPYALREFLEDAQWVCAKVSTLREQIEEQREAKRRFDARFDLIEKGQSYD